MSDELRELIQATFDVVGTFALILAILTEIKVKKLLQTAKEITGSISTRYVGYFPDNMDEIIKLIKNTKRRLIIICDVPAYGHFSSPHSFAEYDQAIRGLRVLVKKVKITLITYNAERRYSNSKNQFNKTIEEIMNSPATVNYLEYHKDNKQIKLPEEHTVEAFYEWLGKSHIEFLVEMSRIGVEVYESAMDLRAFGWISDDSAIFSFYNYGNELREVSFKTNDLPFINILKEIAENSKNNSVEYNGK